MDTVIDKTGDKTGDGDVSCPLSRSDYDGLNQLVREDNAQSGDSMVYAYDAGGNMTAKTYYAYTIGTLGQSTSQILFAHENDWSDQLTGFGGIPLLYDDSGNLTQFGNSEIGYYYFEWENGRQLASLTDSYGKEVSYKYDQNGMRTQKVRHDSETGDEIYDYTYIGSMLVSETLTNDPALGDPYLVHKLSFIYGGDGTLVGIKYFDGTTTEIYYYIYNLQGDVIGLYDSDGAIVARYVYDSWGEMLDVTDAIGNDIYDDEHIGNANPIRYRGYYFDEELYMYYCQSRHYMPGFARFLNADALFVSGNDLTGANMYAYCENNPIMFMDGTGYAKVYSLISDWAGRSILKHYLYGNGESLTLNGGSWGEYMKASADLRSNVIKIIKPIGTSLRKGTSKKINMSVPMIINNGEDIVGYQYLHGADESVGGFNIKGTISKDKYGNITYNLTYTWNDIIDPNPIYASDMKKSAIAKVISFGRAKDYVISISWADKTVIKAHPSRRNQSYGWLSSNYS